MANPLLHYGGQVFELDPSKVTDIGEELKDMRTAGISSGVVRVNLANGGALALFVSDSIPFAMEFSAEDTAPAAAFY